RLCYSGRSFGRGCHDDRVPLRTVQDPAENARRDGGPDGGLPEMRRRSGGALAGTTPETRVRRCPGRTWPTTILACRDQGDRVAGAGAVRTESLFLLPDRVAVRGGGVRAGVPRHTVGASPGGDCRDG